MRATDTFHPLPALRRLDITLNSILPPAAHQHSLNQAFGMLPLSKTSKPRQPC
jgi:hypothetical protein